MYLLMSLDQPENLVQINEVQLAAALNCPTRFGLSGEYNRPIEPLRRIGTEGGKRAREIIYQTLGIKEGERPTDIEEVAEIVNFPDFSEEFPDKETNPDQLKAYLEDQYNQVEQDKRARVIALSTIFVGNLQSSPLFIVISEKDGFVPVMDAKQAKDNLQVLSLLPVKILRELGLRSDFAMSFNTDEDRDEGKLKLVKTPFAKSAESKFELRLGAVYDYYKHSKVATQVFCSLCKDCFFQRLCFSRNPGSPNLSLLAGLNEKEQKILMLAGIFTQDDLIEADPNELVQKIHKLRKGKISYERIKRFQKEAELFASGEIELMSNIEEPEEENQIYLDYETITKDGKRIIYFSGALLVNKSTGKKVYYPNASYGEDPESERKSFEEFWKVLQEQTNNYEETAIFYYNCDKGMGHSAAERLKLGKNTPTPYPINNPKARWVNVYQIVKNHMISPHGMRLKTLAEILYEEKWKIQSGGKELELTSKSSADYWNEANRNIGTEQEESNINALKSYNLRDVYYLFLIMHNFPGARRLRRPTQQQQEQRYHQQSIELAA